MTGGGNEGAAWRIIHGMRPARLLAACLAAFLAIPAAAQNRYPVQPMNFHLWCQEQARLPVARCDERRPEDERTFEAYRAQIERHEIPFLEQRRRDAQLDRNILRNDPQDRSTDLSRQTQSPARVTGP